MISIQDKVDRLLAIIVGDGPDVAEKFFRWTYDELRATARQLMEDERSDHTLPQPRLCMKHSETVIHEPGMGKSSSLRERAAMAMRRILVDHARNKGSIKRGRGWKRIKIEKMNQRLLPQLDWSAIDEALQQFRKTDERAHEVVMLRFFGVKPRRNRNPTTNQRAASKTGLEDGMSMAAPPHGPGADCQK